MINRIKELPDVKFDNPVPLPAPPLCVNIDVASNKEVNYGLFKSIKVECSEKGVTV